METNGRVDGFMEYEWERSSISYVSLGRNIREIRRKRGFRQSDMAGRLEISLTHYSNCERGIRKISLELLLRMCIVLDAPLEALLSGAVDGVQISRREREEAVGTETKWIHDIWLAQKGCSENTRRCMKLICETLAKVDKKNW